MAPGVVVAGAVEVGAETGCGPCSIFSVFGPWKPTSASRRTAPPIAIFFCLASFAFSGSTRFAITRSPRFLSPRCLRAAAPRRPPSSPAASSSPAAAPRPLRRVEPVDVCVQLQRRRQHREAAVRLGEVDARDREEPPGCMQLAAAHRHERAQPEEEVGEGVEGAVEGDVDRHDLVRRDRECRLRRDRLEADAGLVGDPRELEQDPRHVGRARHRDREPEDVGDGDRLRVVLRRGRRERIAQLERGGGDLLVEAGRLGLLRADDHEVAGRGVDEDDGADDRAERAGVQLPLHEGGTWASAGTAGAGAEPGGADVGEDRELDELALVQQLALARLEPHVPEVGDHGEPGEEAGDAVLRVGRAGEREAGSGGRRLRRVGSRRREVRQPDVLGQHERDLAEHAVPGDAAGERRGERADAGALLGRERVLLGRVDHRHGRNRRDLRPQSVELLLLAARRAAGAHHHRREHHGRERRAADAAEEDAALRLEAALRLVAGQ